MDLNIVNSFLVCYELVFIRVFSALRSYLFHSKSSLTRRFYKTIKKIKLVERFVLAF